MEAAYQSAYPFSLLSMADPKDIIGIVRKLPVVVVMVTVFLAGCSSCPPNPTDAIIVNELSSIKEDMRVLVDQNRCYWNGYSEGLTACYATQK